MLIALDDLTSILCDVHFNLFILLTIHLLLFNLVYIL